MESIAADYDVDIHAIRKQVTSTLEAKKTKTATSRVLGQSRRADTTVPQP